MMDGWQVLCYDHELSLLWSQQLMDIGQLRETHRVKAMAALVSSFSVNSEDRGSVVVGGSFVHKDHDHG